MRKISISLLAAVICLTCAVSMSAQSDNVLRNPQVSKASFAITPPLRDLVKNQPTELQFGYHQAPPVQRPKAASYQQNPEEHQLSPPSMIRLPRTRTSLPPFRSISLTGWA